MFGDTVIQHVAVANRSAPDDWSNVVVAGSDGSTYSSVMSIDTAKAFVDDGGSEVVTFNNSIVYLHMEGLNRERHASRVYSVPITRSAIDSPTNAGMVMAPFMYRDLADGRIRAHGQVRHRRRPVARRRAGLHRRTPPPWAGTAGASRPPACTCGTAP